MSLTQYHHGVRVLEVTEGIRPFPLIETSVIGFVATGPAADVATFPLNTAVLITDIEAAIGKAGNTGTLPVVLNAISKQTNPLMVIVRVTAGADEAATNTAVIGTVTPTGQRTGLQALLSAQSQLGIRPRILGAPGLDTQPVATELAAIAEKLNAFAYATCSDTDTVADALAYREDFSARELMLIHPDFRAWDTATNATKDVTAVAYALGLRAKIDNEVGWHKTISNVAVAGVTGISRDVSWDLQSSATDAGVLNQAGITTLVNQNGFRFWGSRTCSDEPLFVFESAVRTAQVLRDSIAEGHMWAVDKPMHPSIVKDILEGVNAKFRDLKTRGYILDGKAWFDESVNQASTLKSGQLVIDYDYTPLPPIEDLAFRQRITDKYFADFAKRVATA